MEAIVSGRFYLTLACMAAWNPRQVATENIDRQCGSHQNHANPEAPVLMHALPIRARAGFTRFAAVSFEVVPVAGHLFSIVAQLRGMRIAARLLQSFPRAFWLREAIGRHCLWLRFPPVQLFRGAGRFLLEK